MNHVLERENIFWRTWRRHYQFSSLFQQPKLLSLCSLPQPFLHSPRSMASAHGRAPRKRGLSGSTASSFFPAPLEDRLGLPSPTVATPTKGRRPRLVTVGSQLVQRAGGARATLITSLRVLWIVTVCWAEWGSFWWAVRTCEWPDDALVKVRAPLADGVKAPATVISRVNLGSSPQRCH